MEIKPSILRGLLSRFRYMFDCHDSIRIEQPMNSLFLIVGRRRHTKDDKLSAWIGESGERVDFEYLEEHCVASGETPQELIISALDYKRLSNMSMKEFLLSNLADKMLNRVNNGS